MLPSTLALATWNKAKLIKNYKFFLQRVTLKQLLDSEKYKVIYKWLIKLINYCNYTVPIIVTTLLH